MVDTAEVHIWGRQIGAVRWDGEEGLGAFQYSQDANRYGWDLSPIMMPLRQGDRIYRFPGLRRRDIRHSDTFKGLPGMLADVLPDHYGNRLIDLWLARQGRPVNSMNPVEKLCFIGARGMGALEFYPPRVGGGDESFQLELDDLVQTAQKVLADRSAFRSSLSPKEDESIIHILKVGTSAGGARPKAVVAIHPETMEVRSGQGAIPEGFSHYLIKLDGVQDAQLGDPAGWGRVEYAYYLMAVDCEIEMMPCQLYEENGRAHFLTERYDRDGTTRHHVQTWCGIQHFDYNEMKAYSYEQLFQTMRALRLTYPEAEQMYRRMVFNVLASNCDDHTKNFSFILRQGDRWRLAPAYDVCYAYDPTNHWVNQQTLSINGRRDQITAADLLTVARANSIKKGAEITDQIRQVVQAWPEYAHRAGVQEELMARIGERLTHVSHAVA